MTKTTKTKRLVLPAAIAVVVVAGSAVWSCGGKVVVTADAGTGGNGGAGGAASSVSSTSDISVG
jgi:hypothetical protein